MEDIAENFGQIIELGAYSEPLTVYDEMTAVADAARKQGVCG